jgi:hypothetical protein
MPVVAIYGRSPERLFSCGSRAVPEPKKSDKMEAHKKPRTGRGFSFLIIVGSGFLFTSCSTHTEKADAY